MVPDFGGLIWMIAFFVLLVIGAGCFILFVFWVMPPIARALTTAKWSGHVPAFIQDETGKVRLHLSNKEFPEGVVHYKGRGWFLIAKRPYDEVEEEKRGPGRPRKLPKSSKSEEERKELMDIMETLIHTPILEGFGKQVFFGCSDSVALSNLKTLATVGKNSAIAGTEKEVSTGIVSAIKLILHSSLRNARLLAPIMYSKTQLDALATGNRMEGAKMFGTETVKIIIIAIAVIGVIVTAGLVFWFLSGGGK